MRFRRRADESSVPGTPDADGVRAVFAAVLDGRRLTVAVEAVPAATGTIGLRTSSGDVLGLPDDGPPQAGYLSARLDLTSLPAEEASYDVVVVPLDGGAHAPVTTGPVEPGRTPVTPDGTARHGLLRSESGALVLKTVPVEPAHELALILADGDEVSLVAGPHELAHADLLTQAGPTLTPVQVGPDLLPVRRRDDDLPDPGRGAPLPSTSDLRLRWSADGLLLVRAVGEAVDDS